MQQNTIKQMEQTVEQLLAKAEELKQQIEKAKEQEDVWPKDGDKYWFALSNADVDNSTWNCGEVDEYRMMFGNTYKTKEDAENYVQKRLIQVELETLAKKAWKESGKQTVCSYNELLINVIIIYVIFTLSFICPISLLTTFFPSLLSEGF
jgi:seryl-tRNA synthetase